MLRKKMIRDVLKNKTPFIAIFLMMFMGNFIFSGITSEYNGMQSHFDTYIKETQLADAWVYGQVFTEADIEQINQIEGVSQVEERVVIPVSVTDHTKQTIDLSIKKQDQLSKMYLVEGQVFNESSDGIWLDEQFAKVNNYHIEDSITLEYQGMQMTKVILGLYHHPEYIYSVQANQMLPDHQNYGFALMSQTAFPYPQLLQWNQLLIKGEGAFKTNIQSLNPSFHVLSQTEHPTYSMITDEINQHKEIGLIFVVAFVFIAILVTITTVHRLLSSQRRQIGILKAMGFNKRQLFIHYVSHSSIVCLSGALLGYLLGYLLLPPLILSFLKEMYTLPNLKAELLPNTWLLPIGCSVLCLFISLFICRKYLLGNAAKILYSNTNQKVYRQLPFPNLWKHLSFSSHWNARDILRNKLRSAMTVFGVMGCVALLFGAFGLYTSMDYLMNWNMNTVQTYETKINGDFSDTAYTTQLLLAMDGEPLMEGEIEIKTQDQTQSATLMAITSQRYIHLMKNQTEAVHLDEGIALSKKIAESLDVTIGDQLEWKLLGSEEWYQSTITQIIRTPTNQGITLTTNEMARLKVPWQTTSVVGNAIDESLIKTQYTTSIQNKVDLQNSLDTLMQASIMMCGIFIVAAVLLGSVILYNLGTLSYNERYYEMATLKVLGFMDKRVRKLMIQQNFWLTAIGIILGIPLGYQFILVMLSTIQDNLDVMIYIPYYVYGLSIIGTLFLSWLINKVLSLKINHIDMVSALKASE